MTLHELKLYFGSGYRFNKITKMSPTTWLNWFKQGYIPLRSQVFIEKVTNGELRAKVEDGEKFDD